MAPRVARLLVPPDTLLERIDELARMIREAEPRDVLLVTMLKGGVPFLADLVRRLDVGCEIDFLRLSPYPAGEHPPGSARIVKDLDQPVTGRHVLVVEDVVDTGLTLSYLLGQLAARNPASLEVCALLDRSRRRIVPLPTRYRGLEIDDVFMLGYGLDYGERYRNHPGLVIGDLRVLERDPGAYVSNLYGREHHAVAPPEAAGAAARVTPRPPEAHL